MLNSKQLKCTILLEVLAAELQSRRPSVVAVGYQRAVSNSCQIRAGPCSYMMTDCNSNTMAVTTSEKARGPVELYRRILECITST